MAVALLRADFSFWIYIQQRQSLTMLFLFLGFLRVFAMAVVILISTVYISSPLYPSQSWS